MAVVFTPDSAFVISGSCNGDLMVWDAMYGHGKNLAYESEAHDLGVTCCDFSPTYGSAGKDQLMKERLAILQVPLAF